MPATIRAPRTLPFTARALLAPMEGVTEPCFRELVLARNSPDVLGGAFTEFVRVSDRALPEKHLQDHLGRASHEAPVGLQIMGAAVDAVAETARRAEQIGAPLIDLNFGCPAKGALRGCAGAGLLDHPARVAELVGACVAAVESIPVTAKIRAGGEDDSLLEDLARAVEAGGASLLTVHCRTRSEGYRDTADWERLRRAVAAVSIPVCGNGGIEAHADLERLRGETGCELVMVGRAVLADPWIFSGREVGRTEAAGFLVEYAERLHRAGASTRKVAGRIKQLIRVWRAGGLFESGRESCLAAPDPLKRIAEEVK